MGEMMPSWWVFLLSSIVMAAIVNSALPPRWRALVAIVVALVGAVVLTEVYSIAAAFAILFVGYVFASELKALRLDLFLAHEEALRKSGDRRAGTSALSHGRRL